MRRWRSPVAIGDRGVNLRTADVADHLNEQNGLTTTMLVRDTEGTVAHVIGRSSRRMSRPRPG